jgi:glycosyltransferase involved in cell wall biosynthesis
MRRLATEPGLVERLSRGALKRSEELSWDNSARTIAETYWRVVMNKNQG